MPEPEYKHCSRCETDKPAEDFNRCSKRGRQRWCRVCSRKGKQAWDAANPGRKAIHDQRYRDRHKDKIRALKRAAHERNPAQKEESIRRYAERYPERVAANQAVANAVRGGTLHKPDACEDCGSVIGNPANLHAHHEDYSRPRDVEWLCRTCHGKHHRVIVDAHA